MAFEIALMYLLTVLPSLDHIVIIITGHMNSKAVSFGL